MDASLTDRYHVITGGPGAGKTMLITALATEGLAAMPEAGRAIIQDQLTAGGTALPWADRASFAEIMLASELRAHEAAAAMPGPVLFDRGVPDVVGYLTLCGLPIPSHVQRAAERVRYNRRVFIAPPWPEIYVTDTERKQSLAEAEATYHAMRTVYSSLGYALVELPRAPLAERVGFVRALIG